MNIKFGCLDFDKVLKFLIDTDNEFQSPLSTKVNLEEYARKLSAFSSFAYCEEDGDIAGMISCYTNSPPSGYISNVCIKKKHQGKGLFSQMFSVLLQNCKSIGIGVIRLEVNNDNISAQNIYRHTGFTECGQARNQSIYMEYII